MSDTSALLELKEKIDDGKVKYNKLQGQKEEALKSLKKEFKCTNIKQGKAMLKKMETETDRDEETLNKQVKKLAKKVEENE